MDDVARLKAESRAKDERRLAAGLPVDNGLIPPAVCRGAVIKGIGGRPLRKAT